MYPVSAPAQLLQLVAAGLLDLESVDVASYPLADLPVAMEAAAAPGGPMIVVLPNQ